MYASTVGIVFSGLFGTIAVSIGLAILVRPEFGRRFFEDWYTVRLNVARVAVTCAMTTSASATQSPFLLAAAGVFALATVAFGIFTIWEPAHRFVQANLVESERSMRTYVACVILPVGGLLLGGALFG